MNRFLKVFSLSINDCHNKEKYIDDLQIYDVLFIQELALCLFSASEIYGRASVWRLGNIR